MMDLISFPAHSRVWIYASDTMIEDEKIPQLYQDIIQFTQQWTSHQYAVRATGGVLHNYFVVLLADEDANKPGGCSIDASVRFIKQLETKYRLNFFNRQIIHYLVDDQIHSMHLNELAEAYKKGLIHSQTLVFDSLVSSKGDFLKKWVKPLQDSWVHRFVE